MCHEVHSALRYFAHIAIHKLHNSHDPKTMPRIQGDLEGGFVRELLVITFAHNGKNTEEGIVVCHVPHIGDRISSIKADIQG